MVKRKSPYEQATDLAKTEQRTLMNKHEKFLENLKRYAKTHQVLVNSALELESSIKDQEETLKSITRMREPKSDTKEIRKFKEQLVLIANSSRPLIQEIKDINNIN